MTTRVVDILPAWGVHGSRPASGPDGTLYSCTTHSLVYRYTTAGGWVTWATLGATSTLTTKGDILSHDGSAQGRLAVGSNGQVLTADSTQTLGVKWAAASATVTAYLKDYAEATRTAGDLSLASTSIADVDTGLDLVLNAAIGDLIFWGIDGNINATAPPTVFDVYTIVSASPVNPFGPGLSASAATLQGLPGLASSAAAQTQLTGEFPRTLLSGDISSGTVTLRLRYVKTNTTARTLFANTNIPLKVWAKNYGQAS